MPQVQATTGSAAGESARSSLACFTRQPAGTCGSASVWSDLTWHRFADERRCCTPTRQPLQAWSRVHAEVADLCQSTQPRTSTCSWTAHGVHMLRAGDANRLPRCKIRNQRKKHYDSFGMAIARLQSDSASARVGMVANVVNACV